MTAYLAEAEELRLFTRIESNFECLRREGRVAGVLSGWGDALQGKYRRDAAEKGDLSPGQSHALRRWLAGSLSGRGAMVEFLQCDRVKMWRERRFFLSRVSDWCGLSVDVLQTEWLFVHVFSRPPQALIYETLLLCAEDALERKPEDLTAQQINLALRKLALINFPAARNTRQQNDSPIAATPNSAPKETTESMDCKGNPLGRSEDSAAENGNMGGSGISRTRESAGSSTTAAPAPEDQYLRIQIAMELLRLHVSPSIRARRRKGTKVQANASVRGNRESSGGSGAEFCDEFSDVSAVAAEALGGVDAETVLHREFDALFSASQRDRNDERRTLHDKQNTAVEALFRQHVDGKGQCAVLDGSTGTVNVCALEKLNKFLERYVDELKSAKVNLERQLKYLEARGAFRVLGFENFGGFGGDDRGGSDDNGHDHGAGYGRAAGSSSSLTESEVRKRYHRLSLRHHPDKGGDVEVFRKLKKAYETVLDWVRRNHERSRPRYAQQPRPPPQEHRIRRSSNGSEDDVEDILRGIDEPDENDENDVASANASETDEPSSRFYESKSNVKGGDDEDEDRDLSGDCDFLPSPGAVPKPPAQASVHGDIGAGTSRDELPRKCFIGSDGSGGDNGRGAGDSIDEHGKERSTREDEEAFDRPTGVSAPSQRRDLAAVSNTARSAAKRAASLAHICIQWSKVVVEVRTLSRPRGVDHLSNLINKGAFSSVLAVMDPTTEAALAVMDVVSICADATKESKKLMLLADEMGFFKAAEKVTTEGRSALAAAAAAADVNTSAIKAIGRLESLGTLARDDDDVHAALVDMLCLHFSRVAESAQRCAKQAIVAVTAASQLSALVEVMADAARLDSEGSTSGGDNDNEESDSDRAQREVAEAEARGRSSREERRKADIRGEQSHEPGVTAVGGEPGLGVGNEDDGDTVSSLLEKLSDLHVAIRMRHCQNLKLTNNAVLELQRQVAQCVKDTDPIFVIHSSTSMSQTEEGQKLSASSSYRSTDVSVDPEHRHLLSTLADLANETCISIDAICRTHKVQDGRRDTSRDDSGGSVDSPDANWWSWMLQKETDWLSTLAYQDRLAIAATTRGKVLRLAAILEPYGVRCILLEMRQRIQGALLENGLWTQEVRTSLESRFKGLYDACEGRPLKGLDEKRGS